MESGSIQEVTERLRSWCIQRDPGLARVEWDSVYTRQDVVDRLKRTLSNSGISVIEMGLPPGEAAEKTVTELIEKLRTVSGSVVSITGIEWAFPERGNPLETLVALSFKREILASLPVHQIWWVPSSLTERFILAWISTDNYPPKIWGLVWSAALNHVNVGSFIRAGPEHATSRDRRKESGRVLIN
jgi:hypothetical protein